MQSIIQCDKKDDLSVKSGDSRHKAGGTMETKAAKQMREAMVKTKQFLALKTIPSDVCKYLNVIKDIKDKNLPWDIVILKKHCEKGGFHGVEAYPSIEKEFKKYNIN